MEQDSALIIIARYYYFHEELLLLLRFGLKTFDLTKFISTFPLYCPLI